MATRIRRERKLPVKQLAILSICRFAEPIASTSLYPYLPEMVLSFGVAPNEVAWWAGICAGVFSAVQAVVSVPWGRFSDIYGRKPAILIGLFSTMCTSIVWGFSTSLPVAIAARALAGAGNGNVGIIRTTVAEMVPFKELQPRAFSIMPLVWNTGSIVGPAIGGFLANPLRLKPEDRGRGTGLFEVFPYSLPNIVNACFFAVSITVGILFLEETLETLHGRRDWGLRLGDKIAVVVKTRAIKVLEALRLRKRRVDERTDDETEPLLKTSHLKGDEDDSIHDASPKPAAPSFREVMTRQAAINLLVYSLLAMHSMAFDQLLPVFLHHEPIGGKASTPYSPPIKFAGGFGMKSYQIGLISTVYGIAGIFVQFLVFPPVCRRYGVLFCMKVVSCTMPVAYFLLPFTALITDPRTRVGAALVLMLLRCCCGIFAFPCSMILLTNSASSLRTLGTLNGFATSFAAIGRATGPVLCGAIFSVGVTRGYVIAPWWFLAGLAVLAAIPVFWLVEGEGFGGDGDVSGEEIEDESDGGILATTLEGGAEAAGEPGSLQAPILDVPGDKHGPSPSATTATLQSEETESPLPSRKSSARATRQLSIPEATGSQGKGRRYSSNLGRSYGSAGSYMGNEY